MLLYPRLPRRTAEAILGQISGTPLDELARGHSLTHPSATFAPTGGNAAAESDLLRVRTSIVDAATAAGYPDVSTARGFGQFDHECARGLYEAMRIVTADAASPGVWAFIACVVAPDVACWRFANRTEERLLGGPRNTFRRLWWRMRVLGSDGEMLLGSLGEDELVQVMERPTIGGSPRVATHLCHAFLEMSASTPGIGRMNLMREAAKRMIRLAPSISLDALDVVALDQLVREVLTDSVVAQGGEVPDRAPGNSGGIDLRSGDGIGIHGEDGGRLPPSSVAKVAQGPDIVEGGDEPAEGPLEAGPPLGHDADSASHPGAAANIESFVPFRPSERRNGTSRYLADVTLGAIRSAAVDSVQAGASTIDAVIEAVPPILKCSGAMNRGEAKLVRRLIWNAAARKWLELEGDSIQLLAPPTEQEVEPLMDQSATSIARGAFVLLGTSPTPSDADAITRRLLGSSGSSRSARKMITSVLNSLAVGGFISGDPENGWARKVG
jgi:hypothetical protein